VWAGGGGGRNLATFVVYIDDSGTSPSHHVALASAIIVPRAQIIRLEREWQNLRQKEHFSSFHTSEFIANNPKSEFAKWSEEKQVRVFRRVREISRKYGALGASYAVNKKDYEEVVPDYFRRHIGKFHYTWAIRNLIALTDKWKNLGPKLPPLEYIFDWMGKPTDERRKEVETVMAQQEELAEANGTKGEYANYSFRHRQDVPGLQCVDALGWTSYQFALMAFRKTPIHRFAEPAWKYY
jgi:Protein of unknown function (DUF3800)